MATTNKPLPIICPILGTVVALGDFVSCFLIVRSPNPLHLQIEMLLAEVGLIAVAILQWVLYFRGYIDQQIEKRLG